jgi:hypothetical protein
MKDADLPGAVSKPVSTRRVPTTRGPATAILSVIWTVAFIATVLWLLSFH